MPPDHPAPDALSAEVLAAVGNAVGQAGGGPFRGARAQSVGGGCISRNFRISDPERTYFLKLGRGAGDMFAAEADGLAALARCDALVVPRVICQGNAGGEDFLVLEWLELDGSGDEARLGEAVAALHGIAFPRFGWHRDNFIGRTPQTNGWDEDWPRFFARRRLLPQLELAAANGAPELRAGADAWLDRLPELLAGHCLRPGLVHGDLWSGNRGFVGGRPALFDPAAYAGDGETDLAMAELFGGFGPRFFAAYRGVCLLAAGYGLRRRLYQLYHLLNHYNLFGGGYRRQAAAAIDGLRHAG
ncbi:MAG TPA: fructosamine kinase family protein [Rhodocyclaceae bacterium]|nr:fructosamine kinase family protein [Rhodocyclaceae bacterium]